MIKKYNRVRYREKFRRYRIFYLIMAFVFLAAFVGELFLFGDVGYRYERADVTFTSFFSDLFVCELLALTSVFLFGVTLYAPMFGFATAAFRGAFSGFCLSVLCSGVKSGNGFWLFAVSLLYLLLSAWLFLAYSTFCTTTALQLFSDPAKWSRGGERRMYGGTLFYSAFSKGCVNARFLLTYCLLFLAVSFFSFLLTLAFAGLQSIL